MKTDNTSGDATHNTSNEIKPGDIVRLTDCMGHVDRRVLTVRGKYATLENMASGDYGGTYETKDLILMSPVEDSDGGGLWTHESDLLTLCNRYASGEISANAFNRDVLASVHEFNSQ